ncbi:MAG: thioredoxin family protein [Planctomycetota bacterium]
MKKHRLPDQSQSSLFVSGLAAAVLAIAAGCSGASKEAEPEVVVSVEQDQPSNEPPPRIRAWMDRLTVDHAYDPETGFIVAKEVIRLPEVIASGPPLAAAIAAGASESRDVVVFAIADRCAPRQQYKRSALNYPAVMEFLSRPGLIATHVEVDREPEVADALLGSRAIPMTYLIRDGERVAELRGQRSAEELLAWLGEQTPAG